MTEARGEARKLTIAGLALALAVCAAATDGRIPIGAAPYTITAPGSYYLTADLWYTGASPAITIQSDNVSLDLNDHTVWNYALSSPASCIYATGHTDLKISNGRIGGGAISLQVVSVPSGSIIVDGIVVSGSGQGGIAVAGATSTRAQITHNSVTLPSSASSGSAIDVELVSSGLIAFDTVYGAGTGVAVPGILVYSGKGLIVEANTVCNANPGISIDSARAVRVVRNSLSGNNYGVLCSDSASYVDVSENDASYNTYGIYFTSTTGCVYRNNLAQGNTSANYTAGTATNGGGNY